MRFPRLSHLFHRRAKSDPELSRLASAPIATPATRPISTTRLADSFTTSGSTSSADVFAAYVPTGPTPLGGPTIPWQSVHHNSLPASFNRDLANQHRSIVSVLTHRVRDLEAELLGEREAHQVALEANQGLASDIAVLQSEVLHLRRELFSALANAQDGPSPSNSDEQFQVEALASENAVLSARCDRLKHFLDLMVATGEPKPVVGSAYCDVLEGEDPEAALVAAIKAAIAQPDNVWRRLLEPVTGVRTQNEYLAQVRCTLDARAQTQDWRKRAKFWKRAAQDDGRHADTVTPSVSAISQVVDALPRERMERVGEMLESMKAGTLPLHVQRAEAHTKDAVSEPCHDESLPPHEEIISAPQPSLALPSSISTSHSHDDMEVDVELEDTQATELATFIPASSSSMVLPPTSSTSTARLPPSVHSNLPPLASETFRASHSIKSVSSRGSRRSSLAKLALTPSGSSGDTSYGDRNVRDSISASVSASTQDSAKSRRRRAKIIAVPVAPAAGKLREDALAASATQSTSRWSFFGPSTSATSAVSGLATNPPPSTVDPSQYQIPSNFEEATVTSGSTRTVPSFELSVETASDGPTPRTPNRLSGASLPKALLDFSSSPEDDLVLVLHSDFSSSPYRAPSVSPTPGGGPSRGGQDSTSSTPEKRSRLPVRMPGLKAIKRFSASINISRPVLVDTTNAASFAFSTAPKSAGSVPGKNVPLRDAPRGRGENAASVGARPMGVTSPSKIPMGRRLQRFGIGGQA